MMPGMGGDVNTTLPLILSILAIFPCGCSFCIGTIIGIVGAGGLGQELQNAINLFKYLDAGVIIALLIVLVNLVDYLSYRVRLVFS
mgnify:CR=1 FL=1